MMLVGKKATCTVPSRRTCREQVKFAIQRNNPDLCDCAFAKFLAAVALNKGKFNHLQLGCTYDDRCINCIFHCDIDFRDGYLLDYFDLHFIHGAHVVLHKIMHPRNNVHYGNNGYYDKYLYYGQDYAQERLEVLAKHIKKFEKSQVDT